MLKAYSQTKNRFYGEAVVKSCIENNAHYLDISGEPEFIERMMEKYSDAASEKGVIVVSACGFDSIPSDIGTVYNESQFPKDVVPVSVEAFLNVVAEKANFTTYECAVHGVANTNALTELRRSSRYSKIHVPYAGSKLKRKGIYFYDNRIQKYCMTFPGSDAAIVRRSQAQIVENGQNISPVYFGAYFVLPSVWALLKVLIFGSFFQVLCVYC